jgi:hypothetical protein
LKGLKTTAYGQTR